MDPRDFLELAQRLSRNENEASLRTAVSRSYYALHNRMSNFLSCEGFQLDEDYKRHKQVYQWLHNCGIEDIESVASDLDDLRGERNRADYEMNATIADNINNVILLCQKANIAFDTFENCISSRKKRSKISKGINNYLRKIGGH